MNPQGHGVLAVALVGTPEVPAANVDLASLRLHPPVESPGDETV